MAKFSRYSGIPLYIQAMSAIRQFVANEGLKKGDRLPSLEELAERFGVARLTIRQAIKRLEDQGLLVSCRGRGTHVAEVRPKPPHMRLHADFCEFMNLSRGSEVKTLKQEVVKTCPLISDAQRDIKYRHWIRVHSDGGAPYGYLDLYLDLKYYQICPERFDREPTMHVTTELPELANAIYMQTLTVRTAEVEEAKHLCIDPGSPVANIFRTGGFPGGKLFFAAVVVYPGNLLQVDMQLHFPNSSNDAIQRDPL